MHVHLRRAGAVALLAAVGGTLSSACVKNESTLFVAACLKVPHDTCIVTPSANSERLFAGTIDAAYAAEYHCMALFENQLVARGDPTKLRTETSGVHVYQAEVQVLNDDPNSPTAYSKFTVPATGYADPGAGTQPGLGAADITLIDYSTLQTIANNALKTGTVQQVVASMVLHARTNGGQEITSGEFKFPIKVTYGSNCAIPVGDTCIDPATKPTADCLVGIDELVDCRLLAPSQLVCLGGDPKTATCPAFASGSGWAPCQ